MGNNLELTSMSDGTRGYAGWVQETGLRKAFFFFSTMRMRQYLERLRFILRTRCSGTVLTVLHILDDLIVA